MKLDINKIFFNAIKQVIHNSLWARYITFESNNNYILNEKVFVYINPNNNFWDLWNNHKSAMQGLGIYMKKAYINRMPTRWSKDGIYDWKVHIPIDCFRDFIFVESGLAVHLVNDLTLQGRSNELPEYLRRKN